MLRNFVDLFSGWLKTPLIAPFNWGHLVFALLVLVGAYALRRFIVDQLLRLLTHLASKTESQADDLLLEAIRVPARAAFVILAIWWVVIVLPSEAFPRFMRFFNAFMRVAAIVLVAWTAVRSVKVLTYLIRSTMTIRERIIDERLMPFIEQILKILLILIGFVMVLQEFGYDPSGLVAGLGLGGLAFALAAQDTLSNFFGSMMILTDKPFTVGDYIEFQGIEGTVEVIGFRSTLVRQMDRTIVQIPNSKLATNPVRNFTRRESRRILFTIGITYECTPAMLRAALEAAREIVKADPAATPEEPDVRFSKFGDSSLDIMVHCYVVNRGWSEWLAAQERMMLAIYERFGQLGIPFAYPAMTVHMANEEKIMDPRREQESLAFLERIRSRAVRDGSASAPAVSQ